MTNQEFTNFFQQMINGDTSRFYEHYWRKRPLHVKDAIPELRTFYDFGSFERDFDRSDTSGAALTISVDKDGSRRLERVVQGVKIADVLAQQQSLVLQSLLLPPGLPVIPEAWRWFVELHQALSDHLLPRLPTLIRESDTVTAVDFFCASADVSSGGHYDTGDVFYFVLDGMKEWVLELEPERSDLFRISNDGKADLFDQRPSKDYIRIELGPGDSLYVPPYTYHRVRSHGRSLAVSLGLPAPTEISLLKAALTRIQREQDRYAPLPTYPLNCDLLSKQAHDEIRHKVTTSAEAAVSVILNEL